MIGYRYVNPVVPSAYTDVWAPVPRCHLTAFADPAPPLISILAAVLSMLLIHNNVIRGPRFLSGTAVARNNVSLVNDCAGVIGVLSLGLSPLAILRADCQRGLWRSLWRLGLADTRSCHETNTGLREIAADFLTW